MCGNVVRNKFNPKRSYFTKTGAFWTNSTTQLLKSFTEAEKQEVGKTRNTCHNYGYESVALIPIHAKNKTIGLVQINDPRENMFTLGSIGRFQLLADHVGVIVTSVLLFYEDAEKLRS
jgi:transcriptional regulator with GAF, ATPase, and Fis domain